MPDSHPPSLSACILTVLAVCMVLIAASAAFGISPLQGSPVHDEYQKYTPFSPDSGCIAQTDGRSVDDGIARTTDGVKQGTSGSSSRAVSPGPGNQTFPQVNGNRVVWMDDRNGTRDIYLYDPVTGTTAIAATPADEGFPSISGDLVAYQKESGPGNMDIFLYRISTGRTVRLTDNPENQEHSSVKGDIIAWEDYRDGVPAIWIYHVATGRSVKISNGKGPATRPRTDGKRVAYEQVGKNGMSYLYVYDITTGVVTFVQPEQEAYTDKVHPSVSGDLVCYQDEYEPGRYSVDIFSLAEDQRVHDRESPVSQYNPDISGDVVAWEQRDGPFSKVHVYRVSTGVEWTVDPGGRDQMVPSIDGMTIVWQDNRDGRDQVYMAGPASTTRRVTPAKTVAPATTRIATVAATFAGTVAATPAPGRKTVFHTPAPMTRAGNASWYTRSSNGPGSPQAS